MNQPKRLYFKIKDKTIKSKSSVILKKGKLSNKMKILKNIFNIEQRNSSNFFTNRKSKGLKR